MQFSSLLFLLFSILSLGVMGAENPFVFVSGYDSFVFSFELNSQTGKLTELSQSNCGANPSYMAWHPSRKSMYAVHEIKGGMISSFSIDPKNGKLTKINEVSSGGDGPCHVAVHPGGKWVLAANYESGHIGIAPIKADGSLGEPLGPVKGGSKAHQIVFDVSGKFVLVPFLGSDYVAQYSFDEASGKLTPNEPPHAATKAQAGPRHVAIHPNNKIAYVINELDSTLESFEYDSASGTLSQGQVLPTLPEGVDLEGKSTAHVVVSPDGKFVYGSNRGHNSIAIFSTRADGRLAFVGHEFGGGDINIPRDFALDQSGKFCIVANQKNNNVTIFMRNEKLGTLSKIGTTQVGQKPAFVGIMSKP